MHATDYVCALRRADEAYRVTPAEPPLSPVPIRRSDYPRAWGSHSLPLRYLFRKASEIARFHHVTALDRFFLLYVGKYLAPHYREIMCRRFTQWREFGGLQPTI
jgi:hypothetical protein